MTEPLSTAEIMSATAYGIGKLEAEITTLKASNKELLAALLLCREYLKYSLGSTSDINPYPLMDAAIAKSEAQS